MATDRDALLALAKETWQIELGEEVAASATGSFFGGTPWAPASTQWPTSSGGAPLTFLCQIGLAAEATRPGEERWLSIFLNEEEGYVEPGDEGHCTIWIHEGQRSPVAVPERAKVLPAREIRFKQAKSLPSGGDRRLEAFVDEPDIDKALRELTGNGGECQVGGYPTIYGGGDLGIAFNGARYELVAALNRYPLKRAGYDVGIYDVLNIYRDGERGRLVADMDR